MKSFWARNGESILYWAQAAALPAFATLGTLATLVAVLYAIGRN